MTLQAIAAAVQRVEAALRRRPQLGLHDDAPATARWSADTRVVASHANGARMETDMPAEMGGTGDRVTPGWVFRAGLASCAATTIAMTAAAEGIEVTELEVRATSRSDTRGLLGMAGEDGKAVSACPEDVKLHVRIGARGVSPQRLREVVERGRRCAPIGSLVESAAPMELTVEVVD